MRLDAIQQMEELGSGFYLAMHDLEIRGAGEVLGENQSGNMMEVGFQLYNDMLSEAVQRAEGWARARPAEPLRRHHRDQPARPGAAARRLLRRRAHAAEPVQAAGHGGEGRTHRRAAGGDHRPLRQAAGAGPDAVRHAPPARAGQALRRAEDRRRAEADEHELPPQPADRRRGASSRWCRRTGTSSWPATKNCASNARSPSRRSARPSCAICCARWASRWRKPLWSRDERHRISPAACGSAA